MVVLKGKKVGRPNGARERYIVENDMEGTTDVLQCLPPARISRDLPNYESRANQEQTRDKVRRWSTLLVAAVTWWDDRAGTDALVVLRLSLTAGRFKVEATITVVAQVNKILKWFGG